MGQSINVSYKKESNFNLKSDLLFVGRSWVGGTKHSLNLIKGTFSLRITESKSWGVEVGAPQIAGTAVELPP